MRASQQQHRERAAAGQQRVRKDKLRRRQWGRQGEIRRAATPGLGGVLAARQPPAGGDLKQIDRQVLVVQDACIVLYGLLCVSTSLFGVLYNMVALGQHPDAAAGGSLLRTVRPRRSWDGRRRSDAGLAGSGREGCLVFGWRGRHPSLISLLSSLRCLDNPPVVYSVYLLHACCVHRRYIHEKIQDPLSISSSVLSMLQPVVTRAEGLRVVWCDLPWVYIRTYIRRNVRGTEAYARGHPRIASGATQLPILQRQHAPPETLVTF